MACSHELVIPEEGSGAVEWGRKGKEYAGETLIIVDIPNTSGDLEKDVAAIINGVQNLVMDKAKYSTDGDKFLSIFNAGKPIYTGKLASVSDNIQKEKMDKATVETWKAVAVVDKKTREALLEKGEKALAIYMNRTEESKTLVEPLETEEALVKTGKEAVAVDENQTESSNALVEPLETLVQTGKKEERCAESDPPAGVHGTHVLSDELVGFILAMPTSVDTEDIPFMTGKYNRSEEWLEEQRQWFKEDAARDQKICDDIVLVQDWVKDQCFDNGCVEVDEDQVAELEKYSRELWDDWVNSGGLDGLKFADPSDPRCAVSY